MIADQAVSERIHPVQLILAVKKNVAIARQVWSDPKMCGWFVITTKDRAKPIHSGAIGTRTAGLREKQSLAEGRVAELGTTPYFDRPVGTIMVASHQGNCILSLCCHLHTKGDAIDFVVILKTVVDIGYFPEGNALSLAKHLGCLTEYQDLFRK